MRWLLRLCLILTLVASLPGAASSAGAELRFGWQNRVDPWVMQTAASGETEFLVSLTSQADLSRANNLGSKTEKGRFVFEQLRATAQRTQPAVLRVLETLGVEYRAYWIANMIWVRGDAQVIEQLAMRPDVAHIYANPSVHQDDLQTEPGIDRLGSPEAIEWNIQKIQAPEVWAEGYTGQGAVIGGQDTGYDWDHPALQQQYRGWDGSQGDHNYNWHDAIHENNPNTSPGNPCDFNSQMPCDDQGHGTHTMGTMVGSTGTMQIGAAPGARWIGCRNMEQGWGTPATYAECYQWFLAPTDLNDQNPDPAKAPDIINNSWGCPTSEGCTDPNVLLTVVDNVRMAGILSVHSAGNAGSSCGSINTPAAIYDSSFTVGNTTRTDTLATGSSRGPVWVDSSGRMKPDISAPGSDIYSSVPGGGYATMSGTSMAGPHVAGLAALLISARPNLAGQPDALEQLITRTAAPVVDPVQTCGNVPSSQIPNNSYGWGRIDALAAYRAAVEIRLFLPCVIGR